MERRQHDSTLTKIANGGHHLSGVGPTVDANDDYGVALACVVQQCGKSARYAFVPRHPQLVGRDDRVYIPDPIITNAGI